MMKQYLSEGCWNISEDEQMNTFIKLKYSYDTRKKRTYIYHIYAHTDERIKKMIIITKTF